LLKLSILVGARPLNLPKPLLTEKLKAFIDEDVGLGDVTTDVLLPKDIKAVAEVRAKEAGVLAGVEEVKTLFELLSLKVTHSLRDGEALNPSCVVMKVEGDARSILVAERTALNILMRMCGIATATRNLVDKLHKAGCHSRVAATRKTAPGLRFFDKKAVSVGGGDTHRLRLDDAVLIKDNHIAMVGSVQEAVLKARRATSFTKKVEVEVRSVDEAVEAVKAGADIVMLDNMTSADVGEAVNTLKRLGLRGKALLEVSGGVTQDNIIEYSEKGVDIVSLGALTHSVKALDLSLEIVGH